MHPKTKGANLLIRGAYPFEGGPSNFPPLNYKLRHWAGCWGG